MSYSIKLTVSGDNVNDLARVRVSVDGLNENLWGKIVETSGDEVKVKLLNQPVLTDKLNWGDVVTFRHEEGQ
jgi:uncharacterized Fe-S cluster-containing radical SAM superfamily protein